MRREGKGRERRMISTIVESRNCSLEFLAERIAKANGLNGLESLDGGIKCLFVSCRSAGVMGVEGCVLNA
jgi:hypothetical protein